MNLISRGSTTLYFDGNWATSLRSRRCYYKTSTSYDENDPEACLDPQFVVDALVDSRPINGRDERCFSSRHSGGAHFLFADGSVKVLSEKCSTTVLRRLASRADGVPISESDFSSQK